MATECETEAADDVDIGGSHYTGNIQSNHLATANTASVNGKLHWKELHFFFMVLVIKTNGIY